MAGALNTRAYHLSPWQFAMVEVAAFLPVGLFWFPRGLVLRAGPDALYGLLVDYGIVLVGLWLWFQVSRRAKNGDLLASQREWLGTLGSWMMATITVTLHVALLVMVVANFTMVVNVFYLPNTPLWVITGSLMAAAAYAAWFDTSVMARVVQVVTVPIVALSVVFGLLLLAQITSPYAVVPSTHLWLLPIGRAAYGNYLIFLGYEVTLALYPHVPPHQRRAAERAAYVTVGAAMVAYLIIFVLIMALAGLVVKDMQWPVVSVMRLADVSTFVIDKVGLFVVILWALFVTMFAAIRLWCLAHDVMSPLQTTSLTIYRRLLVVSGFAAFLLVRQFENVTDVVWFMDTYLLPAFIAYNFSVPLLSLAAARLARWRRTMRSANPARSNS